MQDPNVLTQDAAQVTALAVLLIMAIDMADGIMDIIILTAVNLAEMMEAENRKVSVRRCRHVSFSCVGECVIMCSCV